MTTLVDDLRVRSEPRISDDFIKYEPLLPKGTTFEIVRGPVIASGYSWYLVKLAPGALRDGITQGGSRRATATGRRGSRTFRSLGGPAPKE